MGQSLWSLPFLKSFSRRSASAISEWQWRVIRPRFLSGVVNSDVDWVPTKHCASRAENVPVGDHEVSKVSKFKCRQGYR